jgi:regulator of RNase E activity RraA
MANDPAPLDRLARLYTAVVGDVLDRLGYRQQIMGYELRPLWPAARFVGYALPVQAEATDRQSAEPYKLELAAVDALQPHEVMVVAGAGRQGAFWGELLSTSALRRGARGAVVDGLTRDCRAIQRLGFPLFTVGISPADSYGRLEVVAYGQPVVCSGVTVAYGDLVFADDDGIVVVPAAVAAEAIAAAEAKVKTEDEVRAALAAGATTTATFQRYGVL